MVTYEWDVEKVQDGDTPEREDQEVIEHYQQSSYADCLQFIKEPSPAGSKYRVVLVRDDQDDPRDIVDRAWAYVENGTLPEYFEDAYLRETTKVPKRFHAEVARAK